MNASRVDAVYLNAILTNFLRHGQDSMRKAGHQAICNTMLRLAEDSHVATGRYQLGCGNGPGYKPCPQVRTFKNCVNDYDSLTPNELPKLDSGSQPLNAIGATQRQQVDRSRCHFQRGTLWVKQEGQDACSESLIR